ncbi:MAG: radical SAM family heme chaperone HemW [Bacteroidota bacterium]
MSSLYIHIPFCEHKCIYCDFYSIAPAESADQNEGLIRRFLDALRTEISLRSRDERFKVSYETVFFGGGTPSLLPPSAIGGIVQTLASCFSIERDAEITLEANPGTVDVEKLRALRAVGVNRLSIGIQSFHDDELQFLSRIHSSRQAKECVRDAYRAGFQNVSIDLIFALPSQTRDRWETNLGQAVELNPTHISCYSLIVEPNTPLFRMVESNQVALLCVEQDAELYEHTIHFLRSHGYEQYEVSNFAKRGFKSRHNSNYWNHSNYLGFGPSAHSFWSLAHAGGAPKRWWNIANVTAYAQRLEKGILPVAGEEELTTDQLITEEVFLGLRGDGVDVAGFQKNYGRDLLAEHRQKVDALINDGMATVEDGKLRLTAKGYLVCDEISASFQM